MIKISHAMEKVLMLFKMVRRTDAKHLVINICWLFCMATMCTEKHRPKNCAHKLAGFFYFFFLFYSVFVEIVNFECMHCQHYFDGTIIMLKQKVRRELKRQMN